jgi:hypothetical protein
MNDVVFDEKHRSTPPLAAAGSAADGPRTCRRSGGDERHETDGGRWVSLRVVTDNLVNIGRAGEKAGRGPLGLVGQSSNLIILQACSAALRTR